MAEKKQKKKGNEKEKKEKGKKALAKGKKASEKLAKKTLKKQEALKEKMQKVKEEFAKRKPATGEKASELSRIIWYPLISEKNVGIIEPQNKIVFVVDDKSSKQDIKKAVEELYTVKVDSVNTLRDRQGRKKATVKINKAFKAQELATKLGVI